MYIKIPKIKLNDEDKLYISPKIKIDNKFESNIKVICADNIKKGEILIKEYPIINLFGDNVIDRDVDFLKKIIEYNDTELFPRDLTQFKRTKMSKCIFDKIKNSNSNLQRFFNKFHNNDIEYYYEKHLFNSFEGFDYGPLYLPNIAKLNHSCHANTIFDFNKSTGQMILIATCDIKKNSEITDSYLSNKNISNHNEYLKEHYNFDCGCRCS
jgi:hypothetical protein